MPEKTAEFDPERNAPTAVNIESTGPHPAPTDPTRVILEHVITDIRAMYAHLDKATMEIVEDLRKPDERGVFADRDKAAALTELIDMRGQLAEAGIDPHAVDEGSTEQERTAARDYLVALRKLRDARHVALTGS